MKKNKKNSTDKARVWGVGITVLLVVSGFCLYAINTLKQGQAIPAILSIIIAVVILVLGASVLKRKYTSVKQGDPFEDERSRKIMVLAGYYTFLISIWFLLFLSWATDEWKIIQFRDVSQALGLSILGMAVIFGLTWLWISIRAKTDLTYV
jgi:hypothetical protein